MKKLFVLLLIIIAGCAPWIQTSGLQTQESQNFSAELPQGWMMRNTNEYILTTRDGILLQSIFIGRRPLDKNFTYTKKKLKQGMTPQEISEVIIDNLSSNQAVFNFEIIENSPVKIAGYPGFKLVSSDKTKDGLRYKNLIFGFISGDYYYEISYHAAQRYYYDKDMDTFMKVLESFKLIKTV